MEAINIAKPYKLAERIDDLTKPVTFITLKKTKKITFSTSHHAA